LTKPHDGQVPGLAKIAPHRVQNFEFSSIAGLPHDGQAVALVFRIDPPHLSQNCALGSATCTPQVPHTGNCGSGSSVIAAPHRLQNRDSPSGAGTPQELHFLVIFFLNGFMGQRHKTYGSGDNPFAPCPSIANRALARSAPKVFP
jgi:hypothetical protein